MVTREESTALTRRSLLAAARTLLDIGGPEAVTLREVGARAGVSRSAPYRHFTDKEGLLTAVATESWRGIGDELELLASTEPAASSATLRRAILTLVSVGRVHPHLYELMFSLPKGDPTAVVRAASRTQDLFLSLVGRVVGSDHARRYGAVLFTSAHGITGLELSGHLSEEKWHVSAEQLIDTLIGMLPADRLGKVLD